MGRGSTTGGKLGTTLRNKTGWFIFATCKVHALCRGLARFRPGFRCAGAPRPLPAHARPNKRDIHVLNEYTVTSGCRPSSSPSGSSRASRTTAPGSSSRRRSNGHLCREGAVAVQWSRRRAGARPPSFRHHPAHARTPQLAHATRLVPEVSPAGRKGSLTLYSLPPPVSPGGGLHQQVDLRPHAALSSPRISLRCRHRRPLYSLMAEAAAEADARATRAERVNEALAEYPQTPPHSGRRRSACISLS